MTASYGIHLPHFGRIATAEFMRRASVAAEGLGFDSLWVSDHVLVAVERSTPYPYRDDGEIGLDPGQPFHDPFALLPWVAAHTSTIELGIGAFVAPYRRPLVTAKLIGTLDTLAGGRTRMVAGVGWMKEEFDALGLSFADRGRMTDETLDLLSAAFAEPTLDTAAGPVGVEPRPIRRPYPIMVGGHSKPAMRRALRLGHGWQATPQHPGEVTELLDRLADTAGGDIPDRFVVASRLHLLRFDPDGDGSEVMAQVVDVTSPRVNEVILSIIDPDTERWFARLEALAGWLGLGGVES